ncbi:hypothetical protein L7F22_042453 [Adiantum nelumboides]|nr:hypothetical protein [Adiantum nelumboides]
MPGLPPRHAAILLTSECCALNEALQGALRMYIQGGLSSSHATQLLDALRLQHDGLPHLRCLHSMLIPPTGTVPADFTASDRLVPLFAFKDSQLEACLAFCAIPQPTTRAYHAIISMYAGTASGAHSLHLYQRMLNDEDCIRPNEFTFACVLRVCAKNQDLEEGLLIHDLTVTLGFECAHTAIGDALIDLYTKCGCLEAALQVFEGLQDRSLVAWSSAIGGCTRNGQPFLALELFQEMQRQALVRPDMVILSCILKACCTLGLLEHGSLIHDQIIRTVLVLDVVANNTLIDMYSKHGRLEDACSVFNRLHNPSLMSWGSMLDGYLQNGDAIRALGALEQMQNEGAKPDKVVYLCAVKACAGLQNLWQGRIIHNQVISNDLDGYTVLRNALIDMYTDCGNLDEGYKVFCSCEIHDSEVWVTMLNASLRSGIGCGPSTIELFAMLQRQGLKLDQGSLSCVVKACGQTDALREGRLLHHQIMCEHFVTDECVGNSLVYLYAQCSCLKDASNIFDKLQGRRTVVSWSAIMGWYAQHGPGDSHCCMEEIFEQMLVDNIEPDQYIYSCALKACALTCCLSDGKWVHNHLIGSGLELDTVLGCTLVDMYGKCGELEEACKVFDDLEKKDVVSWGAMISGCVMQGNCVLALCLYGEMRRKGVQQNAFVMSAVLKACGLIGATYQGMLVHDHIIKHHLESDLFVESALIDLYVKCDCMGEANNVRKASQNRSVVSWGALISGYAQGANTKIAMECVQEMQLQGLKPNESIYASAISACGHAGQVEQGHIYFSSMMGSQGNLYTIKPYNCMADVYARAGYLKQASELLLSLPTPPDTFGWASLYSASSLHAWEGRN